MTETIQPPMGEATPRSFRDVLGEMKGIGTGEKANRIETTNSRILETKKWIMGAWGTIKEGAKNVGRSISSAEKVGIALTTPQGREVLSGFLGDKISESRQNLRDEYDDISRATTERGDKLIQGTKARIDSLRSSISEHLYEPMINRGRNIRDSVVNSAKEGKLFVQNIPNSLAERIHTKVLTVQEKIETGAKAVSREYGVVREGLPKEFDSAAEWARDWGEQYGDHIVGQVEAVQQGITDRKNRITGKVDGWRNERKAIKIEKRATVLSANIEDARKNLDGLPAMQLEFIRMKREIDLLRSRGADHQTAAEELRASGGN